MEASPGNRIRRRHQRYALMLGGPALALLLVFLVLPFLMAVGLTFTDQKLLSPNETELVGLRNYDRLLAITVIRQTPEDAATGEGITVADGEYRYKRIRDITRKDPRYRGYRPLAAFRLGASKYTIIAKDPTFIRSFVNTLLFAIMVVPIQCSLALSMALLINQSIKGRVVFRTLYFAPVVMSMVVVAIVWSFLFNADYGLINKALGALSFGAFPSVDWLGNPATALFSIVLLSAWQGAGFQMIIFLAGLQSIPQSLYDAAKIDGANALQRLLHVTLPGLRNTIVFVVIATTIAAFGLFTQIDVMTKGGPGESTSTVMFHAIEKGVREQDIAYGSTISVIYFLIIALIALTQRKLLEQKDG